MNDQSKIENLKSKMKGRINDRLRKWCEKLSPGNRVSVITTAYIILAGACLGMIIHTVCSDRSRQNVLDVEHMKRLELQWSRKDSLSTDINCKWDLHDEFDGQ